MLFSSLLFLFLFFPAVVMAYFVAPKRWRNAVLLTSSLAFYFWGEARYSYVLLGAVWIAWYFGLKIENAATPELRRAWLRAGVILTLLILFVFKYANFVFLENYNLLAVKHGWSLVALMHLPIGVSFFTFQVISYLIDISRGEFPAQKSIAKVAVYKTFFPQLIAGPIVRYRDVKSQIDSRESTESDIAEGVFRFAIGLSQKVLLANTVGDVADKVFDLGNAELSTGAAWLGALAYFFQIYYDFAGYSNMAIGMGRIFGFRFLENFLHPYSSGSITEFWRRWHISLSSWFRDYLFIPLGGSRCSPARNYFNLYVVFILCGAWHGASWAFLFWGFYHGTFLVIERAYLGTRLEKLPRALRLGYTWLVVIVGWVFFRAVRFSRAKFFLKAMLGFGATNAISYPLARYLTPELVGTLLLCTYFAFPRPRLYPDFSGARRFSPVAFAQWAGYAGMTLLSVLYLAGSNFNPFIYFRF